MTRGMALRPLNSVIDLGMRLGSRSIALAGNGRPYSMAIRTAVAQHDVHTVPCGSKMVYPKHDSPGVALRVTRFSPNDYDKEAVNSEQDSKPKVTEWLEVSRGNKTL